MSTALARQNGGPIADYHDREAWLEARKTGIGASEVAAIFGMHPFMTARDLWLEKTGRALPKAETPDMRRGRRLEPVAAELYAERTGRRLRRHPLRRHPEHACMIASIDRQILSPTALAEIKVPRARTYMRWKREGLPPYIVLQGQYACTVTGYPFTGFGVYSPDDDEILTFDVEADPVVAARFLEVVPEWWERHVVRDVPPPEEAPTPDVKLPEVQGDVVFRFDPEFEAAAREYFEAVELEREASAVKELAKQRIIEIAGDYGVFEVPGQFRVYNSMRDGRKTFDRKALEAARPLDRNLVIQVLSEHGLYQVAEQVLDRAQLDLSQFDKQGKPYAEFRAYALKAREE